MAKAPTAMASMAAPAAKMAQPMLNTMAMKNNLLASMAPPPSSIAKIPMDFMKKDMDAVTKKFSKPEGFLDRIFGKMDKDKMRETGLSMMQQAMQQEQVPPMQLAAFQPGGGGGGMGQGQPPALMQLLQQYGLNKIQ